jgi:hypothetical protein
VGRATVTLDNTTFRYSWRRADSALYAQIGYANSPAGPVGVPARIWRGYWTTNGAEYVCIFTGVVAEWGERPDGTVGKSPSNGTTLFAAGPRAVAALRRAEPTLGIVMEKAR